MINDFIILKEKESLLYSVKTKLQLSEEWLLLTNSTFLDFRQKNNRVIIIGDYIGTEQELFATKKNDIPKQRGNFYAIQIQQGVISIYNSFFSLLPLYYDLNSSIISSSIQLIKTYSPKEYNIDKKHILEKLLFNYGFFNRTMYEEINLLPCHRYIEIVNDNTTIHKHFEITEFFTDTPKKGKKVANNLSNLFIETSKHYFPNDHFSIAFTSGFDGRTLVSCASYYHKNFSTFSFGRSEVDDVQIPKNNSQEIGIPYHHINLGLSEYLKDGYYNNAEEYMSGAYQGNGFLQAHYAYSTKKIDSKSKYLLSGYIGSELFRALHGTGTVTTGALKDVFTISDENILKTKLETASVLRILHKNEFNNELNELITEILQYKRDLPKEISQNQQFYIFVFEELFRKFFGQKIAIQQKHIKVRTPFVDYNFVKALLQTEYAGANNTFFTNNPFKRIKGQYLYADIIKKTNKIIYKQTTGKGYRPIDVRNWLYRYHVIIPFLKKKIKRKVKKESLDFFGVISGVQHNKEEIMGLLNTTSFFDESKLREMLQELTIYSSARDRDLLLMALSIIKSTQIQHDLQSV